MIQGLAKAVSEFFLENVAFQILKIQYTFLHYDAVSSGRLLLVFRRNMLNLILALKMEDVCSPETPVTICNNTVFLLTTVIL